MECVICKTPIELDEVSQYAAYGGLPSPCCNICFEVNDYSIKSLEELSGKSLIRRFGNSEIEINQGKYNIMNSLSDSDLLKRIKKRIEDEKINGIKKENVTITEDGKIKRLTKLIHNPFTGGYFMEWE